MNYRDMFNLEGKVAVVIGGAGLLGKAFVQALAEAGTVVVLADIYKGKGAEVIKALKGKNLDVVFQPADITKEKAVSNLINLVDKKYGRIDIWVNSAYPKTKDWHVKFEDVKLSSWRKNIDIHLNGYFICCQEIAEYMKKQEAGSIINLGSIYGIVAPDFDIYKGTDVTTPAAYSAIKGGIIGFTRYLASYYGKYNVRVNCISPGGVHDRQPQVFVKRYSAKTPLKRMANVEDIVGAVVYLSSDASRYVTGHNLVVDGGWSII